MASSVNILYPNRCSNHLRIPLVNLQNPNLKYQFASTCPHRRILRSQTTFSISASVSNLSSQFQLHHETSKSLPKWGEFAGNVSGEWDGFGAEFTKEGKPIELPESVVPEAYREWEVKVCDWQTQCPTFAQPEEPILTYKVIKLLPTVGCEADAATRYSTDERKIGGVDSKVSAFAYHPTGCFVAIWPVDEQEAYKLLEVEHCLVDPRNRESRVRVIQLVRVEKTTVKLHGISVFSEQWYGPFRNGDQLGGCAIRDSGFASTDALKADEVIGLWQGTSAVASFLQPQAETIQELADDRPQKLARDVDGLILLPKQLWSLIRERVEGEFSAEVGWLLDHGHALTSGCVFSGDRTLKGVMVGHETTISEEIQ